MRSFCTIPHLCAFCVCCDPVEGSDSFRFWFAFTEFGHLVLSASLRLAQRVEALEEVEGEKRRLEDLLWEAEKLHTSQREHIATAREVREIIYHKR